MLVFDEDADVGGSGICLPRESVIVVPLSVILFPFGSSSYVVEVS